LTDLDSLPFTSAAFTGLSADILQRGKSLRFRAHGTSMQPLLRDGDHLQVQPVEAERIRIGDVVLCSSQADRIVAHRVLRRLAGPDGYRFLVQGDQVILPDGWIPKSQVYGRVTMIERAGVYMDMNRPVMRALGLLAVLRSMGHFRRTWSFRSVWRLVKRLSIFVVYLS
jgi:signal peptidase I